MKQENADVALQAAGAALGRAKDSRRNRVAVGEALTLAVGAVGG